MLLQIKLAIKNITVNLLYIFRTPSYFWYSYISEKMSQLNLFPSLSLRFCLNPMVWYFKWWKLPDRWHSQTVLGKAPSSVKANYQFREASISTLVRVVRIFLSVIFLPPPRSTLGHWRGGSLNYPILITMLKKGIFKFCFIPKFIPST